MATSEMGDVQMRLIGRMACDYRKMSKGVGGHTRFKVSGDSKIRFQHDMWSGDHTLLKVAFPYFPVLRMLP